MGRNKQERISGDEWGANVDGGIDKIKSVILREKRKGGWIDIQRPTDTHRGKQWTEIIRHNDMIKDNQTYTG